MSVYVISDEAGFVKIGKASDPQQRLYSMQTGNPRQLKLLYTFRPQDGKDGKLEHWLHERYAPQRVIISARRTEWFKDNVLMTIAVLAEKYGASCFDCINGCYLDDRTKKDILAAETLERLLCPKQEFGKDYT